MGFQTKLFVLLIGLLLGVSAYFMFRSDDLPEPADDAYVIDDQIDDYIPAPPVRTEPTPRPTGPDRSTAPSNRITPGSGSSETGSASNQTPPVQEPPLIRRQLPDTASTTESTTTSEERRSSSTTTAQRPDPNERESRTSATSTESTPRVEPFRPSPRPDFSTDRQATSTTSRPTTTTTSTSSTGTDRTRYTVQSGDNLWKIAQAHYGNGTHAAAIAAANPTINPDRLQVGITLILPEINRNTTSASIVRTGTTTSQSTQAAPTSGGSYVTVEEGDTLSKIAARTLGSATQWQKLAEANRDTLPDPDRLRVGQRLRVPSN